MTNIQLQRLNLAETIRSNKANEALKTEQNIETHRHNVAQVDASKYSADRSYAGKRDAALIKGISGAATSLIGGGASLASTAIRNLL